MKSTSGVSDDFAKDREKLKEMEGKLAERRRKAEGLGFIEAGMRAMSGRNIGEAFEKAAPALQTYGRTEKEIMEDEKEYAKIDRDLRRAEDALKRNDVKTYMEFKDKAEQRANELRRTQAMEKYYGKPTQYEQVMSDLSSGDPKRVAAAEKYLGQGKTGTITADDIYRRWGEIQKDPSQALMLKKQGITTFEQFMARELAAAKGLGGTGWGIQPITPQR